jgi:hypothetical protein
VNALDEAAKQYYLRIWRMAGEETPYPWEKLNQSIQMLWKDKIHRPSRGSDVETWLKAERDMRLPGTESWGTLDMILDQYRLRADTGLYLHQDIGEAGPHAEKS